MSDPDLKPDGVPDQPSGSQIIDLLIRNMSAARQKIAESPPEALGAACFGLLYAHKTETGDPEICWIYYSDNK